MTVICQPFWTILFAMASTSLFAQNVEWIKQIGGPYNESVYSICTDHDGSLYVTGSVAPQCTIDGHGLIVSGWRDIYLAKFTEDGTYQWAIRAGGSVSPPDVNEGENGWEVAYDSISNAIYVCGEFDGETTAADFGNGNTVFGRGSFLAKYDLDGVCQWMKASQNGSAHGITFDGLGNVFVSGYSSNAYSLNSTTFLGPPAVTIANGPFLAKYSSAGNLLWAKSMGTQVSGRVLYRNGTLYFVGGLIAASGTLISEPVSCSALGACVLASLDTSCSAVNWVRVFDSNNSASFVDAQFDHNDEIVVTGVYRDSVFFELDSLIAASPGVLESFVTKFDTSGAQQWALAFPASTTFRIRSSISPDNSIYLGLTFSGSLTVGAQVLSAATPMDLAVLHLSSTGAVTGAIHAGAVSPSTPDILATTDNGCCIAYPFDGSIALGAGLTTTGLDDVFLAKLGAITGVGNSMALQGGGLHIYANPNNGLCTIELPDDLTINPKLKLSVFDSKGRMVQQVPLTNSSQGLRLDISAEAKGVYRVELSDGEQRYSGSIVFE